jgi:hypothetical protein
MAARRARAASRRLHALSASGAALLALAAPLAAQSAPKSAAGGQVLLQLHPRTGDTLWTRLEQKSEVARADAQGRSSHPMITRVTVLARTIVQGSRGTTTTVLTVVDSAEVRSSDPRGAAAGAQAERALRGQQLVLQLAGDGSVESARDARGRTIPRDAADAMAAMPAVFPHHAVSVGERWEREMPLPAAGSFAAAGSARVRAQFRLDSLARGGELAFISMQGEIVPDDGRKGISVGGTMSGAMQVDRQRGWMTDSRFSLEMRSAVAPVAGAPPMRFVTRVTQRLRTMDKR